MYCPRSTQAYCLPISDALKKGINEEEALDYALSQVNNVSKKRLLGNLKELKEQLYALEPAVATGQKENPFLDMLSEETAPFRTRRI